MSGDLAGRGCCEMRCALPPGAPLDIMAFRSGEAWSATSRFCVCASALRCREAAVMTWRLTVTEASKSPKKKRKSLEGSPTSKKARREEALPLPLPPKMAFVEQAGFVGRLESLALSHFAELHPRPSCLRSRGLCDTTTAACGYRCHLPDSK